MELFLQTALSFPTAIYSFLLCVAVIYWLVVAAGLLEVDLLDVEASALRTAGLQSFPTFFSLLQSWLLDAGGKSYREIAAEAHASPTTVVRVARYLKDMPHQGYRLALDRLKNKN